MKRVCENCQYFREGYWCSNSKSVYWSPTPEESLLLFSNFTCDQFSARDKKAPLWMRVFNKIMRGRAK